MNWVKLGKVFDPSDHPMPCGSVGFAQSPQALVFDDFVRIYFSTRAVDSCNGKYRSHVAFVDMHKGLRKVLRVSSDVVIPLGQLGCFDEHGIFPLNVLRRGDEVYGYTCGWSRRVSVPVETAIGLAISKDGGTTFQRVGDGPVMAASRHEPLLVGDGFVKVIDDVFHMWHIFGTCWKRYLPDGPPERIYKIGHATSRDGVRWDREEGRRIVADRLGEDESQALPTVIEIDGRYEMFFCYRHSFDFRTNRARGYRIGRAWSHDLVDWTREDDPVAPGAPGEWDSDMLCYPHLFECDDRVCLLYNGNEFGRRGFGLAVLER